jgi:DNA-nicking Smr family endonuclease
VRSKRKKARTGRAKHPKEAQKAFAHRPFEQLAHHQKDLIEDKSSIQSGSRPDVEPEETDQQLFQRAMEGVVPLADNRRKIVKSPGDKGSSPPEVSDQDTQARDYLASLVNGSAAWDVSFSDEYIEGAVSGVSPKIMRRLKRGEFSIQDYIDLHGLTKKEAESAVNAFLLQSYQRDLRCVLIVHGRGLGSTDQRPAIKTELPVWLRRGALKRIVLAFVTARPYDGGAGAIYVLLRKR